MIDAFRYLAELEAYDPDTGTVRTLRFASGTGFVSAPTDSPADTLYEAVLAQPVELSRHIFSPGTTEGQSRVGFGDLIVHNSDGAFDALVRYAVDGRAVRVLRGPATATNLAHFAPVFIGTADRVEFTATSLVVKLRDRQAVLRAPLQTTVYGGTNVLPAGLDGVADLAGRAKPLVFGRVFNVEPVAVNTARLIYQLHDGALSSVDGVSDRGVALTAGAPYATLADLQDDGQAPAPGTYRAYLAGGYVRLGASPVGQITADVTQGATLADRTAAGLVVGILDRMGIDASAIRAGDLTALAHDAPAELGLVVRDGLTAAEALDLVADTIGAWWGVSADGSYRLARLQRPTGPAVWTFTADDLIGPPASVSTADAERGMPAYAVTVRYARNWTVQPDVAAGVSEARRAFLSTAWRDAREEDASVRPVHPLAVALGYDSLFVHEADARREAARRLRIRAVRRFRFDLTVPFTDETAALDLGDVIGLQHPRFGLTIPGDDVGQKFVILGVEPDARGDTVRLTVWGNSFTTYNLVSNTGAFLATQDGDLLVTGTR